MFGMLAKQNRRWSEWDHAIGVPDGNGRTVNLFGRTSLPLRATVAKRIWVNNLTGSSGNNGLSAALPKATWAQGRALITLGAGDQVMIAYTGTPYAEQLGDGQGFRSLGGLSTLYPTLIQSYDPADAANEAKHGTLLVELTGTGMPFGVITGAEINDCKYVCMRGFFFNTPAPAVGASGSLAQWARDGSGALLENCKLRHGDISHNGNGAATAGVPETHPATQTFIMRNFAQQYSAIFSQHVVHWTMEGCMADHGGWNASETRDQGARTLDHNWYLSNSCGDGTAGPDCCTVRYCLSMRASSHGLQSRSGGRIYSNLMQNNPIHFAFGFNDKATLDGQGYGASNGEIYSGGVDGYLRGNVASGSLDINSTNPRGMFAMYGNTKSTARCDGNSIGDIGSASANKYVIEPDNRNELAAGYRTYIVALNNKVKGWAGGRMVEATAANWLTWDAAALTFTAALVAATSGTLAAPFAGATGATYTVKFSDGTTKTVTLTNGSAAVSWTGAVTATANATYGKNFAGFMTPWTEDSNIVDSAAYGTNIAASTITFVATDRKIQDYLAALGLGTFTEQQAADHFFDNWGKDYCRPQAAMAWCQAGWQI